MILIRGIAGLLLCFGFATAHAEDQVLPVPMIDVSELTVDTKIEMPEVTVPTIEAPLSPIEQIQYETEQFINNLRAEFDRTASGLSYIWYRSQVNLEKEMTCLAQNIYYEARGEDMSGQLAIALVTVNRVKMQDYPPTICQVVFQPGQFSWTHQHKKKYVPHDQERWAEAMTIAHRVLDGGRLDNVRDITEGSILFHADYVHPKSWKKYYVKTMQIGKHIFFKAKKDFEYRSDPVVPTEDGAI
jgi:spore germination cell wall hydrolase CwlJ-like protein